MNEGQFSLSGGRRGASWATMTVGSGSSSSPFRIREPEFQDRFLGPIRPFLEEVSGGRGIPGLLKLLFLTGKMTLPGNEQRLSEFL